jgi:alpha-tubulin suppressor-like RCC1 family protein
MGYTSPIEAALKAKRWPKDSIAAGRRHTVVLKSDGAVTAVGDNMCALSSTWAITYR